MTRLPDQFCDDYQNYGDTFFEVIRLLIAEHSRQFTQAELAAEVDVTQARISDFTSTLTDDGWINRHENQTTFSWNTNEYNPTERVATDAVSGLYRDLWGVIRTHSQTTTGIWALFGLIFFIAAVVLFAFYLAVKTGLFGESTVSPLIYLFLASGLTVTGLIMTALTPLQAFVNRAIDRLLNLSDWQY